MSAKTYLKGIASSVLAPVIKSLNPIYPNLGIGFQMMGVNIFPTGLSNYTGYSNKIFYTAQNILVGKLIEAPITFNKQKGKVSKFYSKSISNEERRFIKSKNLQELENHELNNLFDTPNDYQSGIEMMEDFWHNYGFGDGFLYFETLGELSRNKKPIAIHSLKRNSVICNRSNDNFNAILDYTYSCQNGKQIRIPKEQILHLKHWNPNIGGLKGWGVDVSASIDINLSEQGSLAQGSAFVNGGRGTIISSDSTLNNEGEYVEKYSAAQMTALKESIRKEWQGSKNNRNIHFANGYLNVQNYGDTLAELEIDKSEETRWRNIFAICGVPWALSPVGSQSSENSVIQGFKSLVTNTVISELRKFDQKLNGIVKQWYGEIIAIHDLTEFSELAPDLKLMAEVYGKPNLTEDERRSIFGYEEMPDGLGKNILVASGLIKLEDLVSDEFKNLTPPANL